MRTNLNRRNGVNGSETEENEEQLEVSVNEEDEDKKDFRKGIFLIIIAFLFFFINFYSIFISKLLPYTGNSFLDSVKEDRYYCLLLPVFIPATAIFVYFNWLSLKFFRHN